MSNYGLDRNLWRLLVLTSDYLGNSGAEWEKYLSTEVLPKINKYQGKDLNSYEWIGEIPDKDMRDVLNQLLSETSDITQVLDILENGYKNKRAVRSSSSSSTNATVPSSSNTRTDENIGRISGLSLNNDNNKHNNTNNTVHHDANGITRPTQTPQQEETPPTAATTTAATRSHPCPHCPDTFYSSEEQEIHLLTAHPQFFQDERPARGPLTLSRSYGPTADDLTPYVVDRVRDILVRNQTQPRYCTHRLPPPIQLTREQLGSRNCAELGIWRGIEGNSNSCYLDVVLMAVFGVSNRVDYWIECKENHDTQRGQIRCLLRDIVYELRNRHFVPATKMLIWRDSLNAFLPDNSVRERNKHPKEKEFDEFIHALQKALELKPILTVHSNLSREEIQSMYWQFLPNMENLGVETTAVQSLVDNWFRREYQIINEPPPPLLFLQMPKSAGSSPFKQILPSFCLHVLPKGNEPMYLQAVICVHSGHYVTFLRVSSIEENEWVYFNSMYTLDESHCVPVMQHIPGLGVFLKNHCLDINVIESVEDKALVMKMCRDMLVVIYEST